MRRTARLALIPVLPVATLWAWRHEIRIIRHGTKLSPTQLAGASSLGITHPERVRVLHVDVIPPWNPILRAIGQKLRLISSHTIGITLRYGIFIRRDHCEDAPLLLHELVHVAQYERLGGFWPFLRQYLAECIHPGYPYGPLEQEARRATSLPLSSDPSRSKHC